MKACPGLPLIPTGPQQSLGTGDRGSHLKKKNGQLMPSDNSSPKMGVKGCTASKMILRFWFFFFNEKKKRWQSDFNESLNYYWVQTDWNSSSILVNFPGLWDSFKKISLETVTWSIKQYHFFFHKIRLFPIGKIKSLAHFHSHFTRFLFTWF